MKAFRCQWDYQKFKARSRKQKTSDIREVVIRKSINNEKEKWDLFIALP